MVGYTNHTARQGRNGDTMMAHVTPGEKIVPKQVLDKNPDLVMHIAHAIRNSGADPDRYTVGHKKSSVNPQTGNPEFWGFGGLFHSIFHSPIFRALAPAAAAFIPGVGPLAAAGIGAGLGLAGGGGIKGALTGAASGYGGSMLNSAGSAAGLFGDAAQKAAGDTAFNSFLSGTGTAGAANSVAAGGMGAAEAAMGASSPLLSGASRLAQAASLGSQIFGGQSQAPGTSGGGLPTPAPYKPVMPGAMPMPSSLNPMSAYDPTQMRSALATQGVNQGLGSEEQKYYTNLLQRSLIGPGNKVNTSNPNFLMPIESQYFSQRGLNTSNPNQFLSGLSTLS